MQIRTLGCDRLWCGPGGKGRSIVLYYNSFVRKDSRIPSTERAKRHVVHTFNRQLTGKEGTCVKRKENQNGNVSVTRVLLVGPGLFLFGSTDRSLVISVDHIPGSC